MNTLDTHNNAGRMAGSCRPTTEDRVVVATLTSPHRSQKESPTAEGQSEQQPASTRRKSPGAADYRLYRQNSFTTGRRSEVVRTAAAS